MTPYTYNAKDDALVAWNSSFTSRIGDGTGDAEEEYHELVKVIATCKTGARYLDIGCGLGRMLGMVRDRVGSIVGLEPDVLRFQECHAAFHDGLKVHVWNETSTAYRARHPDAVFDLILVSMVVQHVPTGVCDHILRDVTALLARDGVAVIATTQQEIERFTVQMDQSCRSEDDYNRYAEQTAAQNLGIPVRQFSKESFLGALHNAGLGVVRWGQFSYIRPEKLGWFANWIGTTVEAIKDVGTSQYAVVQRRI